MEGRADAQRNRAHILDVAREAFAEDPLVSLNTIAKRAKIGAGTLYRHFPSREALLLTVYEHEIDTLSEAVALSLEQQEPLDAFRDWARRLAALVRTKHGLGDAISTADSKAMIDRTFGPVVAAIGQLLNAAAARGDVRPGIDPGDVLLMLSGLWRVPPGEEGLRQADRLLELVIASVRP